MKGLILFTVIYQMHAVLNLLIIHGKEKINNIILSLAKQNPLIYCQCRRKLAPDLDCLPKFISKLENVSITFCDSHLLYLMQLL